jgi:hypothetical protein
LQIQNRMTAEPAMRGAAARVGAALLPSAPERVDLANFCDMLVVRQNEDARNCVVSIAEDQRTARILHSSRNRIAVPVRSKDGYYARLARRGNTLFLLVPTVTRSKVREGTECTCRGGMYELERQVDLQWSFVIDDGPIDKVEEIPVPVTEQFAEWKCKLIGR